MVVSSGPSIDEIRAKFPGLKPDLAFFENAGGSQLPASAIEATRRYMTEHFVQLGATYPTSAAATEIYAKGREFGDALFGGNGKGRVIFGPSSSVLIRHLADAYAEVLKPGDEIIIAITGHEANVGPWIRLQRQGVKIVWWNMDPDSFVPTLEELQTLVTARTRIVAFPQVSNLLGDIVDIAGIVRIAHAAGAKVVVDSVAYAPHRALCADEWGADWVVFSAYKVYAPHLALMWGREESAEPLVGPNHFFIDNTLPYKFELGCQPHELVAGLLGTAEYLAFLAEASDPYARGTVVKAFNVIRALELPTQELLINYLLSKPEVKIIGPAHADSSRVGTISFISDKLKHSEIVNHTDANGIAIRNGHMYAYRLCEALGIDVDEGVVRVSLAHYNTTEEVERLIQALEEIL